VRIHTQLLVLRCAHTAHGIRELPPSPPLGGPSKRWFQLRRSGTVEAALGLPDNLSRCGA
jgi:hypothetical protein